MHSLEGRECASIKNNSKIGINIPTLSIIRCASWTKSSPLWVAVYYYLSKFSEAYELQSFKDVTDALIERPTVRSKNTCQLCQKYGAPVEPSLLRFEVLFTLACPNFRRRMSCSRSKTWPMHIVEGRQCASVKNNSKFWKYISTLSNTRCASWTKSPPLWYAVYYCLSKFSKAYELQSFKDVANAHSWWPTVRQR
jgi:hypothetical protein